MRAGILARLASHHGDIANHVFVQTGVIFEQVATGVAHPDMPSHRIEEVSASDAGL